MEPRKNLNKDLRRQSGLFFQIGLLIALMVCVSAFEYEQRVVENPVDLPDPVEIDNYMPPITDIKPPPPPPKPIYTVPVEAVEVEVEVNLPEITLDPEFTEDIPIEKPEMPDEQPEDAPFLIVEEMPSPVGGLSSFYQYIQKNLKYPKQARNLEIEGTVFVRFLVMEDGSIEEVKIEKGIGAGCDEEVLRVMQKAPKWNPGKQRGKPVKVWKIVPIKFTLN